MSETTVYRIKHDFVDADHCERCAEIAEVRALREKYPAAFPKDAA